MCAKFLGQDGSYETARGMYTVRDEVRQYERGRHEGDPRARGLYVAKRDDTERRDLFFFLTVRAGTRATIDATC